MKKVYEFTCPVSLMRPPAKDIQVKFICELAETLRIHPVSPVLWWYVKAKKVKCAGVSMVHIGEDVKCLE